MATQKLDFFGILSESSKIMKSHSRHFLALSVLFLLPLSFSLLTFQTLQQLITDTNTPQPETLLRYNLLLHQHQQNIGFKPVFFSLLCSLTLLTLSLCAIATISYSLYHGFFGRPVKLVYALKSLLNSLLRLFVTLFCAQIIILVSFIGVGMIVIGVIRAIEYLGFEIDYSSDCFRVFYVIGGGVLGLGLLCLYVNCVLAPVVVVVESSWGLEPLRRSAYLVKGMRGVVVCLLLYFGSIVWFFVWGSWGWSLGSGVLRGLLIVVMTVFGSAFLMSVLLHSVAANAMLYMNCKALRGELAVEIAEEFAREYVSLPFDDEKVPHVVSIVQP